MPAGRTPSLTPDEARQLHEAALVIDTQQSPATSGFLFTEKMRAALTEMYGRGATREEAAPVMVDLAAQEIRANPDARRQYLEFWRRSGVTVACGTYSGSMRYSDAYEVATKRIAQAYGYIEALDGQLRLCRTAADIEQVHRDGVRGLVIDFQNTTPFGDDLDRIDRFYNMGLRMVQLTYNLRNLVGDGCTEAHQSGLTWFGREVVRRLNDLRILVDVSHCSEAVGWDALKVSTAPVIVSHSTSKAVIYHDRGKTDELARAGLWWSFRDSSQIRKSRLSTRSWTTSITWWTSWESTTSASAPIRPVPVPAPTRWSSTRKTCLSGGTRSTGPASATWSTG